MYSEHSKTSSVLKQNYPITSIKSYPTHTITATTTNVPITFANSEYRQTTDRNSTLPKTSYHYFDSNSYQQKGSETQRSKTKTNMTLRQLSVDKGYGYAHTHEKQVVTGRSRPESSEQHHHSYQSNYGLTTTKVTHYQSPLAHTAVRQTKTVGNQTKTEEKGTSTAQSSPQPLCWPRQDA